ncbi:hypothetical protein [Nocardia sp. CNY236]|uniref:hypothetical protein n=1 Tax=Nocardia sp. CNY236 TaxID=1169152 RepID=UPI000428E42D|nr:hypothetical protein [Nocardia sp. CNY236]
MTRIAAVMACLIVVAVVELVAVHRARDLLSVFVAIPVAIALGWLIWSLSARRDPRDDSDVDGMANGPAQMLASWEARTQILADRADGTRAEWDRYLRPLLAREFELASGQRGAKNRRAAEAAGIHQFGPELWPWVDPADSAWRDETSPAPGRAALEEILCRLQRM